MDDRMKIWHKIQMSPHRELRSELCYCTLLWMILMRVWTSCRVWQTSSWRKQSRETRICIFLFVSSLLPLIHLIQMSLNHSRHPPYYDQSIYRSFSPYVSDPCYLETVISMVDGLTEHFVGSINDHPIQMKTKKSSTDINIDLRIWIRHFMLPFLFDFRSLMTDIKFWGAQPECSLKIIQFERP